jgi:hypothetical protein
MRVFGQHGNRIEVVDMSFRQRKQRPDGWLLNSCTSLINEKSIALKYPHSLDFRVRIATFRMHGISSYDPEVDRDRKIEVAAIQKFLHLAGSAHLPRSVVL